MDCQTFHIEIVKALLSHSSNNNPFSIINDTGPYNKTETGINISNGSTEQNHFGVEENTGTAGDAPKYIADLIEEVTFGVLIPVIAVMGIVGNAFSLKLLTSQRMTAAVLLIGIAVSDLLFLLCTSIESSIRIFRFFDPIEGCNLTNLMWNPLFSTVTRTFARISAWLTVTIAVERALAVIMPMKVRRICSRKLVKFVTVFFAVATILTCLPWAFVFTYGYLTLPDGRVLTILKKSLIWPHIVIFRIYFTVLDIIQRVVVVVIVILANFAISFVICRQAKHRKIMMAKRSNEVKRNIEANITKTLFYITTIFAISAIPLSLYRVLFISTDLKTIYVNSFIIFKSIGYLLEVINSSINFIVYVATNRVYRAEFVKILGVCRRKKVDMVSVTSGATSGFKLSQTTE